MSITMAIPKLLTITGPSGSGKSELLNILCKSFKFSKLVSVTTRPPRPGEVDGVDYYFISEDRFHELEGEDALVQTVSFNGAWYGTTRDELSRIVDNGRTPVVIVEPGGVDQFSGICDDLGYALSSVFVGANLDQLIDRFVSRMVGETLTEDRAKYYSRRLYAILEEYKTWKNMHDYDMYVYNTGPFDRLNFFAEQISNHIEQ